eukprot:7315631-Prymnesium_polylepis.1
MTTVERRSSVQVYRLDAKKTCTDAREAVASGLPTLAISLGGRCGVPAKRHRDQTQISQNTALNATLRSILRGYSACHKLPRVPTGSSYGLQVQRSTAVYNGLQRVGSVQGSRVQGLEAGQDP